MKLHSYNKGEEHTAVDHPFGNNNYCSPPRVDTIDSGTPIVLFMINRCTAILSQFFFFFSFHRLVQDLCSIKENCRAVQEIYIEQIEHYGTIYKIR